MVAILIQTSVTGFRDGFSDVRTPTECDTPIEHKSELAALVAAQTGTLTTRTDNDTGVATLSTGHGIVTSDVCDVYWADGVRYGMTATVATNAVTLDGGAGDVLPAESTAVTVVKQDELNINFDGDDLRVAAIVYRNASDSGAKAHVDFQDVSNSSIQEIDLAVETSATGLVRGVNVFDFTAGDTNVFSGNRVTHVAVSHDSASAGTLYIYLAYNA